MFKQKVADGNGKMTRMMKSIILFDEYKMGKKRGEILVELVSISFSRGKSIRIDRKGAKQNREESSKLANREETER